ncbi:hypothetical protein [Ruoffia tabacinasalis]|uniref:PRTase-CE domain-containing protein n=1 Tax=Ruoffia tabacinasalis TaxID=87458 RepID=A0ABS0LLH6_9LACT|nr:hypothetical protein [Ruoffia tabacinasalis]MBG9979126.1 hypothetical protein [Ruoffia tabacinasalis]
MNNIFDQAQSVKRRTENQLWLKKMLDQLNDENEKNKIKNVIINRTIEIYINIKEDEEKELFLDLLDEIEILTPNDYFRLLNKCYVQLRKQYPTIKKYIIVPLLKCGDEKLTKIKSGVFISYLFHTFYFSIIDESNNEMKSRPEIIVQHYIKEVNLQNIVENDEELIVFVDDFIGSGTYAVTAWKQYAEKIKELGGDYNKKMVLVSLSALDIGITKLAEEGIKLIFGLKHLTLNAKFKNDQAKLKKIKKTISSISSSYSVAKSFKLGYKESLSTIITIRTPNNNVPFLWSSRINKRKPLFLRNGR